MRFFVSLFAVGLMLAFAVPAGAITWDLSNPFDYYFGGGGSAAWNFSGYGSVAPLSNNDAAAVLAMVNTQAANLKLADISGGGYKINTFYTDSPGTTGAVYGSLYLSLPGDPANVLILLSPMTVSGTDPFTYTFDLSTPANYRTWTGGGSPLDWSALGNWSPYDSAKSSTFGQVAALVSSSYGGDYAAYFGPQIGGGDTHETRFYVTEINLGTVPEPLTMAGLMLGIGGLVTYIRKRRKA